MFALNFSNIIVNILSMLTLESLFLKSNDFIKANNKIKGVNISKLQSRHIKIKNSKGEVIYHEIVLSEDEMNNAFIEAKRIVNHKIICNE